MILLIVIEAPKNYPKAVSPAASLSRASFLKSQNLGLPAYEFSKIIPPVRQLICDNIFFEAMETKSPHSEWMVYILLCRDGTFYAGITNDLERRIRSHNEGMGSRYTRTRLPVKVVWQQTCANRSEATKIENRLKRFPRKSKEALIANPKLKVIPKAD